MVSKLLISANVMTESFTIVASQGSAVFVCPAAALPVQNIGNHGDLSLFCNEIFLQKVQILPDFCTFVLNIFAWCVSKFFFSM